MNNFDKDKRGIASIAIILIVAAVLALGGGGYYAYQKLNIKNQNKLSAQNQQATSSQQVTIDEPSNGSTTPTANWKTYRNEKYGFEVKHPASWYIYPGLSDGIFGLGLQSSPAEKNLHGVGFPPRGEMWVRVVKLECRGANEVFNRQNVGGQTFVLTKPLCFGRFIMDLSLWEDDSDQEDHMKLLNSIAASFKSLP